MVSDFMKYVLKCGSTTETELILIQVHKMPFQQLQFFAPQGDNGIPDSFENHNNKLPTLHTMNVNRYIKQKWFQIKKDTKQRIPYRNYDIHTLCK